MVQKVHKLESENFELNNQVEKIISGIEDQRRKHVKEVQYSRYPFTLLNIYIVNSLATKMTRSRRR